MRETLQIKYHHESDSEGEQRLKAMLGELVRLKLVDPKAALAEMPELEQIEEFAIEAVKRDPSVTHKILDTVRSSRMLLLEALSGDGDLLRCFPEFMSDKEMVMRAVQNRPDIVALISDELKDDKDVAMAVVGKMPHLLQFFSGKIRDDKETVIEAIRSPVDRDYIIHNDMYPFEDFFQYASQRLRGERDVALMAVKRTGYSLAYVADDLKGDKELATEAMKTDLHALTNASDELKDDEETVMEALRQNLYQLQYASDRLRNKKEVALAAIKAEPYALDYVSDELKDDEEIVMEALRQDPHQLRHASDRLRNKKETVLAALSLYIDKTGNPDHVLSCLERKRLGTMVTDELMSDEAFLAEAKRLVRAKSSADTNPQA